MQNRLQYKSLCNREAKPSCYTSAWGAGVVGNVNQMIIQSLFVNLHALEAGWSVKAASRCQFIFAKCIHRNEFRSVSSGKFKDMMELNILCWCFLD